jgi:hypothetical protein
LQQGTWAIPPGENFDEGLVRVIETINDGGGHPMVLTIADEEASEIQLEELFNEEREAEWVEFLGDCGKFDAELDSEVAKGKLTLAELDEEEESLERLRRWYRSIRSRDLFGAPSGPEAERRLKECAEALEQYAVLVYEARDQG